MGCFSFMCQKCGQGIRSSSFSGEECRLFLLNKGVVIEQMNGQYDSYGSVFGDSWDDPTPDVSRESKYDDNWSRVCDLMHNDDITSGIAGFHSACYDGVLPTVMSEHDPNQGWGPDDEGMGDTGDDYPPLEPIKDYDVRTSLKKGLLKSRMLELERDLQFQEMGMVLDNSSSFKDIAQERIERIKSELVETSIELRGLENV